MSHVEAETVGRPAHWAEAAAVVAADPGGPPSPGERTAVVDCGTSLHVAQAQAQLREHGGQGETDARTALTGPLPEALIDAAEVAFLGAGWSGGLANEAAPRRRKAALLWSEAHSAVEFRHGSIGIAAPDTASWMPGAALDGLADQVRDTGAHPVESRFDPVAEPLRVHWPSVVRATARDRDPDGPRHLTRSVNLAAA
ncbi:hypothetical protein [Streptomyces sp. NRRL B-24484]|uniref:hypothetical protein n=1 Tax=Streptomyces sp. NRRL B-24484 TaxID=1463833 RepID=UPI0009985AF9|nr:hypothetical protein [Streptomyces sp. NRRL B-24484]